MFHEPGQQNMCPDVNRKLNSSCQNWSILVRPLRCFSLYIQQHIMLYVTVITMKHMLLFSSDIYIRTCILLTWLCNVSVLPEDGPMRDETCTNISMWIFGFLCKTVSSVHGYGQDKAVIICRLHSSICKFVFFIHQLVPRCKCCEGGVEKYIQYMWFTTNSGKAFKLYKPVIKYMYLG